jgi:RND family efflux transporter MFP subunit
MVFRMLIVNELRSAGWRAASCISGLLLCALIGSAQAQTPAQVRVATPEPARVGERYTLSGSLTAERHARLSPRVDGLVAAVNVDAGDRVEAGAVLLQLDPALAGHALARAKAASAEAAAALQESERLLAEAERVGKQDFLPATLVAARAAEQQIALAALQSARAVEREQAELLARHALVAPFAGVIAERLTEAGEWVQRGTPVLSLVALDRIRLDLQVPQERYAALNEDAEIMVLPDALPGVRLPAQIAARVPVTDPTARTFLLRLQIEDSAGRLLPGTSARAEIALPAQEAALAISRDALLRQPDGGYRLFVVVDENGSAVARQRVVRVLRDEGEQVAIAEGLSAGERVVIRGNEALRDGDRVQIVED